MKLVIVESPAKAKTIEKYLGKDYIVDASGGHIRDLPAKSLGIDIDNDFAPEYAIYDEKKETIKRLKEKAKKVDEVLLATDPDREGEAISWHLQYALKLDPKLANRIEFNEITKTAILKAIEKPRLINMDLVNAQQARRVLDRLVGYKLSPVLCKKIKGKLSAGRVQSACLKMVVEKEKEIQAFKSEEFWVINALLNKTGFEKIPFKATLVEEDGKKIKVNNVDDDKLIINYLTGKDYIVKNIKKGVSLSKPLPPFTTSTLQQDASTKLGLASNITMMLAQQLYEGIDIVGEGHVALVTYIRTDSVRVSDDALVMAKNYLLSNYGKEYVPESYNIYKSKKNIQDAHEAIRPISLEHTPEQLKPKLQKNQYRLYKLIYDRFLASQSTPSQFDNVNVIINAGKYGFKATGKTLIFDGYTVIYGDNKANSKEEEEETSEKLPPFVIDDKLNLIELKDEQKFTKPPSRYTESSLIKSMEENGIGRPSTYSTILSTLYKRTYAFKDGKYITPTDLGTLVTDYLEKYFNNIVDIEFTAKMEDELDEIEEKGRDWTNIVKEFYTPFKDKLLVALNSDENVERREEVSDVKCEKCGGYMIFKTGRFGKYLACGNYPECKNTKSLKQNNDILTDIKCEKCGAPMVEKNGRFGKYLACSSYPDCKNTISIDEKVGVCPKCKGDIVKRFTKGGRIFYGCKNYPDCDYVSWENPNKDNEQTNEETEVK